MVRTGGQLAGTASAIAAAGLAAADFARRLRGRGLSSFRRELPTVGTWHMRQDTWPSYRRLGTQMVAALCLSCPLLSPFVVCHFSPQAGETQLVVKFKLGRLRGSLIVEQIVGDR